MENKNLTKQQAYDIARREFYRLRQQEDIERRIAVEEARMVGGYFGKNTLQVGMQLEDKAFEGWKEWARAEIVKIDSQRAQAYTDVVDLPADLETEEVAA